MSFSSHGISSLCMSLLVWLPGPMFLPGRLSVSASMFTVDRDYQYGNVTGPPGALLFDVKPEIALK